MMRGAYNPYLPDSVLDTSPDGAPHSIATDILLARQHIASYPWNLNGKPATVGGVRLRFARVYQIPNGAEHQWCWSSLRHAMLRGNFDLKSF